MFDAHKKHRTAVLVIEQDIQYIEDLVEDSWKIVNLNDFYENLNLWYTEIPNKKEIVDLLFSSPIDGIKQYLANTKDTNVGLSGCGDIAYFLIPEYHKRGYDVIIVNDGKTEYIPCYDKVFHVTRP